MNYISNKNSVFEYEIKKSKFIAMLFYTESSDEIKKIIEKIKKEHSNATHICYAFVILENGIKEKAFDDGEPSSTAGKPILECIKKNNLVNTLVVVVRYFGGIKLGAGGLIRAYASSAKFVIESVKDSFIEYKQFDYKKIEINYNKFEEFKQFCKINNIEIVSSNFDENIILELKFEKGCEFNFDSYKN